MATETVPAVMTGLATLLAARPTLAGPPAVPVYPVNLGNQSDAEAIVWTLATITGARFLGWGSGPGSGVTVQPLTLNGYLFTAIPGNDTTKAAAALARAGVLLGEIAQQLRDTPTIGGALDQTHRWQPPLLTSAAFLPWIADLNGTSVARVRVEFTISWQALDV
jgi:hypothetical protein